MLRIRFQRMGKIRQAVYRIIVSERTRDTQYTNTEILGTYDPTSKKLEMNKEKIQYWIGVGAQPSTTLHNIFVKEGLIKGKKEKSVYLSKKRKTKIAAKKAESEKKAA
jgi:small subunit ribosomal protein S16